MGRVADLYTKIVRKNVARDSHHLIVLNTEKVITNLTTPLYLPNPGTPSEEFQEDFWCTQILMTGTQNAYWELELGLTAALAPIPGEHRIIVSGYIAKLGQNLPMTVNAWMKKGTRARIRACADLGGVEAAGDWIPQALGYYETVRVVK